MFGKQSTVFLQKVGYSKPPGISVVVLLRREVFYKTPSVPLHVGLIVGSHQLQMEDPIGNKLGSDTNVPDLMCREREP